MAAMITANDGTGLSGLRLRKVSGDGVIRSIADRRVSQTPQVAGLAERVHSAFQSDDFRARFGIRLLREAGPYGGNVKLRAVPVGVDK